MKFCSRVYERICCNVYGDRRGGLPLGSGCAPLRVCFSDPPLRGGAVAVRVERAGLAANGPIATTAAATLPTHAAPQLPAASVTTQLPRTAVPRHYDVALVPDAALPDG